MIYLHRSEGKGRGVFALSRLAKGTSIERAPVLVIPATQWQQISDTDLGIYSFSWGENNEEAVIALGYGSLYNHSYTPNAIYLKRLEDLILEFVALRDIEAGEEITVNYNGHPASTRPVAFNVIA